MHYLLYSKNRNYKDKQNNTQNCFLKIILLFPVSFFANFTQRKKERKKKNKKQMRYYKNQDCNAFGQTANQLVTYLLADNRSFSFPQY